MANIAFTLNTRRASFQGFLFSLCVYPYLFALNMFIPSALLGGKCVYIYAVTVILIISFLFQLRIILCRIPAWSLFLFILLTMNIVFLNLFFYSGIKHVDVLRIPFNLVIYLGVAYSCIRGVSSRKIVYNVIVYNCIIQAVVGIIHYFFFPGIMTGVPGYESYVITNDTTPQAERGLLISSNLYSLFLILGCFLVVYRNEALKKKWIVETIYLILLITGIVLSNSRLGLLFSALLFLIYFKKSAFQGKAVLTGLIIIGITIFHGFIGDRIGDAYQRSFLYDDSYTGVNLSRVAKNTNALDLLIADWSNVLIGPSKNATVEFKLKQDRRYSDNSFFLLFHNYGLPSAVIIIVVMAYLFSNVINIRERGIILFLFYFISALFFYNCVLFDIWLFFFSASLVVLSRKNDIHSNLIESPDSAV